MNAFAKLRDMEEGRMGWGPMGRKHDGIPRFSGKHPSLECLKTPANVPYDGFRLSIRMKRNRQAASVPPVAICTGPAPVQEPARCIVNVSSLGYSAGL